VIYSDSADKAARFIMNCNQKKIPLLFCRMLLGLWWVVGVSMAVSSKTVRKW